MSKPTKLEFTGSEVRNVKDDGSCDLVLTGKNSIGNFHEITFHIKSPDLMNYFSLDLADYYEQRIDRLNEGIEAFQVNIVGVRTVE